MDRPAHVFVPHVVVTRESLAAASDDPGALVASNIAVVVRLGADALLEPAEMCRDAMLSYYVEMYRDQVASGGFAQFVWNTGWEQPVVELVRDGLAAIGAPWHSRAFDAGAEAVAGLGADRLAAYVDRGYAGWPSPERDALDAVDDEIRAASRMEDLTVLNALWLRSRPGLVAEDDAGLAQLVARVAAEVPDRAERLARAEADEPPFIKVIMELSARAGHRLQQIAVGDPAYEYQGHRTTSWLVRTDRGNYVALEDAAGGAVMLEAGSGTPVAELSATSVAELTGAAG
jgi:hypothetical protein